MQDQCPHSMEPGTPKTKIESLEREIENINASPNCKILELEKQINLLAEIAKEDADFLLQGKARRVGFIKAMHTTATLTGYAIIIFVLLAIVKFMKGLDFFIKFVTSLIVK
ncbi:hypothetical protein [Nitrosomonas communis]|uniref:Uncharacterized protein n=1 Tax=Nitrosomonas communis TaxID=44574 RepID=A0A1H2Y3P2_9PROT|nr:hypothetical protein [Nitrosomonas communis]SDW99438.1 hypothetical protein SAMN05421882_10467 [Nitrosomonas communis]